MSRPPHVIRNEAFWNATSPAYQRDHAAQLPTEDPTWGVWGLPESELQVLGEVADKDVLELGCGGAQWSIALARRGARVTGLDLSAAQLAHARALVAAAGLQVRLLQADAEAVPLPNMSFDVVFCDHGAMSFTDPYASVPEASRLLRPGGLFAFNAATPFTWLCCDDAERLDEGFHRPYFGLHRWEDFENTTFLLPYGEWIRLFRRSGLLIEDLIELQPPEGATTTYGDYAPLSFARRWPAEQIWKLRKG